MIAGARVLAGVPVRAIVTAARGAAFLTCAQVNPLGADLDTLFAFSLTRLLDLSQFRQMRTGRIIHD
jgi:hypothetical protein